MVRFIGGEPTLHPSFTAIMARALQAGLDVEVYSNLVHVTNDMWELFQQPHASLAFSYFAPDAAAPMHPRYRDRVPSRLSAFLLRSP